MSQAKTIRRPIADTRIRMNPGHEKHWAVGGTRSLVLGECNHVQYRKLSQGLPNSGYVRCKECEGLRDGRIRTVTSDSGQTRESWNAETGRPLREVIPAAEVSA